MSERIKVGEVVIEQQGALQRVATYYKGHLNLDNFQNWGGQHLEGFTGPETRIESKRLEFHIIEPIEQKQLSPEIPQVLEVNQSVTVG